MQALIGYGIPHTMQLINREINLNPYHILRRGFAMLAEQQALQVFCFLSLAPLLAAAGCPLLTNLIGSVVRGADIEG